MWNKAGRKRFVTFILLAAAVLSGTAAILAASDRTAMPAATAAVCSNISDPDSNRYSRPETYVKVQNRLNLEEYSKVLEDSRLQVWHKEKNTSIRILDKSTGYIWGGLPSDKPEDMNSIWSGIGNSLVSIDYFDAKGIEKRLSIADKSVEKSYTLAGTVLKYSVKFKEQGISFSFEVELKNGSLIFRVVDASICEEDKYSLASVYFVPFLGSARADEIDGYMFIPDGPGALIRFAKPSHYLISFDKRIYGKDYGIDSLFEVNDLKSGRPNDFATEEPGVLMPVFGVVQGVKQNAYFARVEKGAEYASILAVPSGILTNYNWVSAKFIYRQKYLQPTSKSGAGVQVAQKERNRFDAEIRYRFLNGEDADYVGMAKLYKDLLHNEGQLPEVERTDSRIPLQLDVIGADIEKGFIRNGLLPVTTPRQITEMVNDLTSEGIDNLTLVLKGWQRGGLNGSKPSAFSFEGGLGGKKALIKLQEFVQSKGGTLYFYENPVTVNNTQLDLRKEAGNALSQALIKLERNNTTLWFKDTYFIESNLAADYVARKAELYRQNGMAGMALDEFGSRLYAENQRGHVTTRQQALQRFKDTAAKAAYLPGKLALYKPNQYLWKYAAEILSTPMVNGQYLFETDTVPFLQIVLKGSLDYYAPYANISFYSRTDILKMIEYGAYPSFLLTGMENYKLKHTPVSELYSTRFEDWRENILSIYNEVNSALSRVEGNEIIGRTVIQSGLVKVDYQNGLSVLVNYTQSNRQYDGMTIPAQGFAIAEGE